jgi:hypothetical protein
MIVLIVGTGMDVVLVVFVECIAMVTMRKKIVVV